MGFREIGNFNKALLGKQCWRLITKEGSLIEKVFKSRYYPRGSFLEAKAGYQPTYAWRSILCARDVVQKGGRWQVVNGEKVRIWHDKWLPIQSESKIRSPISILEENATVDALNVKETKQWNRDLVFYCSSNYEAR